MPDLSVVIVNYNTRDLLRSCLRSLRASEGVGLEIIVVDNASSDGSAAMVRAEFPEARLLAQSLNTWFCGGNNIGIRAATADYALLLNPDTEVAPGALALMLRTLRGNPDYAGVSGQMLYPDGGVQRTCSRQTSFPRLLLDHSVLGYLLPALRRQSRERHFYGDWDRLSDRDVDVLPGSCMMMRRADILLDEDLLLYFPEDSLARGLGRKCRFLAGARIIHHEKSATRSFFATRIFFRDMLVYCRKQFGLAPMLLLWLLSRPVYWVIWVRNRQA